MYPGTYKVAIQKFNLIRPVMSCRQIAFLYRDCLRGEHTGVLVPRPSIDQVSIGSSTFEDDHRTGTHVWLGSWWNVKDV
jgi:hypothetical protein